jgi:hypothetical protein
VGASSDGNCLVAGTVRKHRKVRQFRWDRPCKARKRYNHNSLTYMFQETDLPKMVLLAILLKEGKCVERKMSWGVLGEREAGAFSSSRPTFPVRCAPYGIVVS